MSAGLEEIPIEEEFEISGGVLIRYNGIGADAAIPEGVRKIADDVFAERGHLKRVTIPVEIDFMKVSSYGSGTKSSHNINIHLDLQRADIDKCDLIVVEDIIDSGRTLSHLTNYLTLKGARSVRTCTLLDKPSRREVDFTSDYIGREIPDHFVVGYSLDFDEKYRTLPYVGILRPEAYEK